MIRILLLALLTACGSMEGDVNLEGTVPSTSTETSTETETEEIAVNPASESDEDETTTDGDNINVNVNVDVEINTESQEDLAPHGLLEIGMSKEDIFEIFGNPDEVENRDYPSDVGTVWKWTEKRGEEKYCADNSSFTDRCEIEFNSEDLVDDFDNINGEYVKLF